MKNIVSIVIGSFWLNSCISVISPQTADTLPPGQMSGYIALSTPLTFAASKDTSSDESDNEDDSPSNFELTDALSFDVGTRYGVSENLDFGAEKTGLITRFDFKRRVFGSEKGKAIAIGAGLGSNNLSGFLNSSKSGFFIRTSDIPIYFSTKIGEASSLYSILRYHYTHIESKGSFLNSSDSTESEDENSQSSSSARNLALSVGGVFGQPAGFFIEVATVKGMDKVQNNGTRVQIALGVSLLNSVTQAKTEATPLTPVTNPKTPRKTRSQR